MNATTTSTAAVITCARPGCGAQVPLGESGYINGSGRVCLVCFGPLPQWLSGIEPF